MFRLSSVRSIAALGLAAVIALAPAIAEARAGLGSSSGSRGSRTSSAPPSTATAPRTAQPIERSAAPATQPGSAASRPATAPQPSGGFFGSALGRGLMGGLLGAGLMGLLMGNGLMGGLGSMMSFLGLILQLGLVFLLVKLAMNWFASRRQQQPATAAASAGPSPMSARSALGGLGGGSGMGSGSGFGGAAPSGKLTIESEDYSAFEHILANVQTSFGEENLNALRALATSEMVSYFAEDIAEVVRKGHANRVSGVKLLQGDLSEAWREDGSDYATVAMRFSLVDTTVDRVTGKLVSGDASGPVEATEVWTFVRPTGSGVRDWKVSAIQQV